MHPSLLAVSTGQRIEALLTRANEENVRGLDDNWNFNWPELFQTKGSDFFKITTAETPEIVEGLVMFSVYFGEMVFMNNLELAPRNIGKKKKYDWVAGCLIAYGCRIALEKGKGAYQGYLTFESKSSLIPLYREKYGATYAGGLKMFIDDVQGEKLIQQYLEPTSNKLP